MRFPKKAINSIFPNFWPTTHTTFDFFPANVWTLPKEVKTFVFFKIKNIFSTHVFSRHEDAVKWWFWNQSYCCKRVLSSRSKKLWKTTNKSFPKEHPDDGTWEERSLMEFKQSTKTRFYFFKIFAISTEKLCRNQMLAVVMIQVNTNETIKKLKVAFYRLKEGVAPRWDWC